MKQTERPGAEIISWLKTQEGEAWSARTFRPVERFPLETGRYAYFAEVLPSSYDEEPHATYQPEPPCDLYLDHLAGGFFYEPKGIEGLPSPA